MDDILVELQESAWSRSQTKRVFDCVCVLLAMPIALSILGAAAIAVAISSRGPILFIQQRVGRNGKFFPILKLRTMAHVVTEEHNAVTTSVNQKFTCVGPFLRRWKIDELPQLFNVLMGHMSLVGPRPKIPEHSKELSNISCRPGITGAATLAFAAEERVMARIPHALLNGFYHDVVLPAKNRIDADYMASATFTSDLSLLVDSVLRRWNNSIWMEIPDYESLSSSTQNPSFSLERSRTGSEFYRARTDRDLEEMAK